MQIFTEDLIRIGMADTRAKVFAEALNKLHASVCYMDQDNVALVKKYFPEILCAINAYAEIEELRKIT